jgi:predicted double-glycine peptidase
MTFLLNRIRSNSQRLSPMASVLQRILRNSNPSPAAPAAISAAFTGNGGFSDGASSGAAAASAAPAASEDGRRYIPEASPQFRALLQSEGSAASTPAAASATPASATSPGLEGMDPRMSEAEREMRFPTPPQSEASRMTQISVTWQINQKMPDKMMAAMERYEWSAADVAKATGQTLEQFTDYLTLNGAAVGFGGVVTLTRQSVSQNYQAAMDAAIQAGANPGLLNPWNYYYANSAGEAPGVPAFWTPANVLIDGESYSMVTASFSFDAFNQWYASLPTPESQFFARVQAQLQKPQGSAAADESNWPASTPLSWPAPSAPLAILPPNRDGRSTIIPLQHQQQVEQNACGPTALAMILSHLQGRDVTAAEIAQAIRRRDVGTPPSLLVDYAQKQGLAAAQYNNGSWDAMKAYLDQGLPCMALIDQGSGKDFVSHYVNVVGYSVADDHSVTLLLNDPFASGQTSMSLDSFLSKWDHIKLANIKTGYNNFFMVVGPKGAALSPSNIDDATAFSVLSESAAQFVNGWDLATGSGSSVGDRLMGVGHLMGASVGLAGSAPAFLTSSIGQSLGGGVGSVMQQVAEYEAALAGGLQHAIEDNTQIAVDTGRDSIRFVGDLVSLDFADSISSAGKLAKDQMNALLAPIRLLGDNPPPVWLDPVGHVIGGSLGSGSLSDLRPDRVLGRIFGW